MARFRPIRLKQGTLLWITFSFLLAQYWLKFDRQFAANLWPICTSCDRVVLAAGELD